MAITVSGTSITFNDGTTQTTAGGAPTTAQVLSATAGASAGAVGTYAIRWAANTSWTAGSTVAGSTVATGLSGTWRAMMASFYVYSTPTCPPNPYYHGVYLRIS